MRLKSFIPALLSLLLVVLFGTAAGAQVAPPWGDGGFNWVGDYSGDGLADIASATPDGQLIIRRSTGRGFVASAQRVSTAWGGRQYSWADDFNNDGKTDIVTARGSNIYLHLSDDSSNDSRSLRPTIVQTTVATLDRWGGPGFNWVGDFNGDGFQDLASALPNGEMVMRLFDGSDFDLETWQVSTPWGGSGYSWAADYNNDGKTDLATARDSSLFLHLSQGDEFKTTTLSATGWGEAGYNWTGDFNGDGFVDLASAVRGGTVTMRLGSGQAFDSEVWTVDTDWGGANYSWAADFNGDGRTDLASARDSSLFLHLSTGQDFESATLDSSNAWGQGRFNGAGDFDGDGRADIAAVAANGVDTVMRLAAGSATGNEPDLNFEPRDWKTTGYRRP